MYMRPETTARVEREELGRAVRRCRYAVLVWASQALNAVGDKRGGVSEDPDRTPVQQLQHLLVQNLQGGPGELRLTELLATGSQVHILSARPLHRP
ncbi:hypothetical protein EDD33_1714 [Nocardioides aurantiacus]|uniref:Uncharacterized protein n=1 Tax=Nocardioides aurantiacus TaxID=86796 RepID=A0A3N2CTL8_9ACTN|nr:hypothetical protein EDD33_1714 [Nocardioides aurantiacus]